MVSMAQSSPLSLVLMHRPIVFAATPWPPATSPVQTREISSKYSLGTDNFCFIRALTLLACTETRNQVRPKETQGPPPRSATSSASRPYAPCGKSSPEQDPNSQLLSSERRHAEIRCGTTSKVAHLLLQPRLRPRGHLRRQGSHKHLNHVEGRS